MLAGLRTTAAEAQDQQSKAAPAPFHGSGALVVLNRGSLPTWHHEHYDEQKLHGVHYDVDKEDYKI